MNTRKVLRILFSQEGQFHPFVKAWDQNHKNALKHTGEQEKQGMSLILSLKSLQTKRRWQLSSILCLAAVFIVTISTIIVIPAGAGYAPTTLGILWVMISLNLVAVACLVISFLYNGRSEQARQFLTDLQSLTDELASSSSSLTFLTVENILALGVIDYKTIESWSENNLMHKVANIVGISALINKYIDSFMLRGDSYRLSLKNEDAFAFIEVDSSYELCKRLGFFKNIMSTRPFFEAYHKLHEERIKNGAKILKIWATKSSDDYL